MQSSTHYDDGDSSRLPLAQAGSHDLDSRYERSDEPEVLGGGLIGWVVRRILSGVGVLLAASILIFAATQALPGNIARQILGRYATDEQVEQLGAQLGLNRSLSMQYVHWLTQFVQGSFGSSLATQEPVSGLIGDRLLNSLALLLVSGGAAIGIGLVVGTITAAKRDSLGDRLTQVVCLVLTSLPVFVIGLGMLLLLATNVTHLLPAVALIPPGGNAFEYPKVLILPGMTLALAVAPYLVRLQRAQMIDVLEAEYIEAARLKGIGEYRILGRHAARNAFVPIIQGSALTLIWLMGGIVTVEYLFAYPGIGSLLTQAVQTRDVPIIQAVVLILAASYVITNLVADVLTVIVTPRLRTNLRNKN